MKRSLVLFVWLWLATALQAQTLSPREELVALVPADSGFCLVVQGLRGHVDKWQRSPWFKAVRESAPAQAFLNSPDIQHLARVQDELKRRLDIDWPTLRDDVLGDAVVFAYRPPQPGNPDQEQGMMLVHARKPELVTRLLDRLNQEQKKSGELKELATIEYRGVKYQRRVDARTTHFIHIDGNVLALAGKEALIRGVIDQRQGTRSSQKQSILQQLNRGGAEHAVAALWVNPRAFEAELEQRAQKDDPEAVMLRSFLAYWKPMDAIVLSASDGDNFELKLAMQARTKELPQSLRKIFTDPAQASDLWSRFPSGALLTMADRADLGLLAESLADFSPPASRKAIIETLQKTVGAALSLDLAKDVVPNVGPDWGLCIAAGDKAGQFPQVLAAVAVRPGAANVDEALFKGVQFFATWVTIDHNSRSKHPLQLKSVKQGKVDVRYFAGDNVFPAGVQPAWALKDGYLVFASSPDAVLRFQQRTTTSSEAPVVRLSFTELARLLRDHRQAVVDHFAEKNNLPKAVANQGLETALAVLDLFDHLTVLQSSGQGQLTWTARLRPRSP